MSRQTFNEFLAGAIGGLAGLTVGHPMDTIKVVMQSSSRNLTFKEVTDLILETGLRRFFTGLAIPFYSYGFINAVIFTAYKESLSIFDATGQSPFANAMAGAVSGAVQLVPAVPVEVIKIRQQSIASHPGTIIQAFRDIPGMTTYFYAYSESIKIGKHIGLSTFWSAFIGGAISGALSWCVSMPFDVIKTRQQAGNGITISNVLTTLLKEKSYKIFFRGFNVVITRAFLVNACTFAVYETAYEHLKKY
ncbi:unnamed protein product [Schistosoma margrebowiei]|uniref:Uncharacterized protein n=1 Tax=Schistosoma margrebowiei TaxID=48269 RepID=A0A183MQ62_9TREM|nr:unnamed protein product [Schistosoma margrebowiei]